MSEQAVLRRAPAKKKEGTKCNLRGDIYAQGGKKKKKRRLKCEEGETIHSLFRMGTGRLEVQGEGKWSVKKKGEKKDGGRNPGGRGGEQVRKDQKRLLLGSRDLLKQRGEPRKESCKEGDPRQRGIPP